MTFRLCKGIKLILVLIPHGKTQNRIPFLSVMRMRVCAHIFVRIYIWGFKGTIEIKNETIRESRMLRKTLIEHWKVSKYAYKHYQSDSYYNFFQIFFNFLFRLTKMVPLTWYFVVYFREKYCIVTTHGKRVKFHSGKS